MEELVVKVDGKEYKVFVEETEDGKILVHSENEVYEVETKKDAIPSAIEKIHGKSDNSEKDVTAPLPGIVYDIKIKKGDKLKTGQSMFTLMAMKMENEITAPRNCIIKEINVKKNDSVSRGQVLAVIE
ncbi:MAG: biotin/lipoyl-containing protein [Nanoarchaeota archaeon]